MRCVRVLVSGRVQGVGFRYFVAGESKLLGLAGFVRNLRDGRVEAVFAGDVGEVEALLAACRQGPPGSRVDGVIVEPAEAEYLSDIFEIRRDG